MNRRHFLGAAIGGGVSGVVCKSPVRGAEASLSDDGTIARVPERLGEMTLAALRDDCRRRLFEQYLPFWERGAYDREHGGFCCELNDDGSVASDEKFIWYQGQAVWVYAFLYNHLDKNPRWLNIAAKTRDFLVNHMYAGRGQWFQKVRRDGTVLEGVAGNVYGWLFSAGGLAQHFLATGDRRDLKLAKESLLAAVAAYDDPAYADGYTAGDSPVPLPAKGLRSQGHSMVIVWVLSQLLSVCDDPQLAKLQQQHVDPIRRRFWNPEYGIANEYLAHDYSRLPEAESHMYGGHSLETLWIVMHEALRSKDRELFDLTAVRIRRLLEMCWDYVFDGWADGNYFVFEGRGHRQGADYRLKTMWAQCEIMIACLTVLQYTGHWWAKEWYDRARAFAIKTMPVAAHRVWRQAVDRRGIDAKRPGISTKRKDNFHQARMLMLNLLALERMIGNQGNPSSFPR